MEACSNYWTMPLTSYIYSYTESTQLTRANSGRKDLNTLELVSDGANLQYAKGQGKGFDIDLVNLISDAVNIPVVASSGAGAVEHFSEVFNNTNASAALAAGIFHRKEVPVQAVKEHLLKEGTPVERRNTCCNNVLGGSTSQLELLSTAIMDGWMAGLGAAIPPSTDALGQLLESMPSVSIILNFSI